LICAFPAPIPTGTGQEGPTSAEIGEHRMSISESTGSIRQGNVTERGGRKFSRRFFEQIIRLNTQFHTKP
jgi:hypothetical protein